MFLLNYKDWTDATHTKFKITQSFTSLWVGRSDLSLTIQGQSLSRIYENFVAQVSGIGEHRAGAMAEVVDLNKRIAAMESEIQNMQKKMRREPQYDKQLQMNKQIKAKKRELEQMIEQLNELK
jgi:predicted RNase H-like nuclease (RuvC/YqgF family)